jgi:hypothetical protein
MSPPPSILDYSSPRAPEDDAQAARRNRPPSVVWPIGFVLSSALLGHLLDVLEGGRSGLGVLFMPGVLAGAVWFIVLRTRTRAGAGPLVRAQLTAAAVGCVMVTAWAIWDSHGYVIRDAFENRLHRYPDERAHVRFLAGLLVWFCAVSIWATVSARRARAFGPR